MYKLVFSLCVCMAYACLNAYAHLQTKVCFKWTYGYMLNNILFNIIYWYYIIHAYIIIHEILNIGNKIRKRKLRKELEVLKQKKKIALINEYKNLPRKRGHSIKYWKIMNNINNSLTSSVAVRKFPLDRWMVDNGRSGVDKGMTGCREGGNDQPI